MKILNIYKHTTETNNKIYDAINETLKSGSYNEALYYKYTILVNIEIEKTNDYLLLLYYRAFWESIGDPHNMYDTTESPKRHTFRMSLMTAIEIIYEATPPLLQGEIKNSITSIDNIIEILKTYILEDNPDVILRRGIFLKKNGMFDYGGIWNDSDDRTKKIRLIVDKNNDQPVIAYVDAEVGDFKQYVISGPVDQVMLMTILVSGLHLTHVYVNPSKSLTLEPIVNIKGYTEYKHDFKLNELNTLCESTLKMLE